MHYNFCHSPVLKEQAADTASKEKHILGYLLSGGLSWPPEPGSVLCLSCLRGSPSFRDSRASASRECSSSLPAGAHGHHTWDPSWSFEIQWIVFILNLLNIPTKTQLRTGKTDSNLASSSSKTIKLEKLALSHALWRWVSLQMWAK